MSNKKTLKEEREARKQSVLRTLQTYIGKQGEVELDGLTFEVVISDAKRVYGHDHVLVHPKKGEGEKWMRAANLSLTA